MTTKLYKYARTYHLPYSRTRTDDDKVLASDDHLVGKQVVITEKMDGENCLRADVKISTSIGDISIEEIVKKELNVQVLSVNHETGSLEFKPILKFIETDETEDWFEIETETGEVLYLTENHYVFLPSLGIYRRVKDLIEGDTVFVM